jgi:hypothetical protein
MSHIYLKKGHGKLASDARSTRFPQEPFDPNGEKSWDVWVGEKYANSFRKLGISNDATILEIGPGSVSKVGEGLKQYGLEQNLSLGFQGTIIIIEPELNALEQLSQKYKLLMPNINIITIHATLQNVLTNNILDEYTKIDAVVGNHPLDDFISGKSFNSEQELIQFFTNHYEGAEAAKTASQWEKIAINVNKRINIFRQTVDEWNQVIEKCDSVILSAYDSHFFRSNESKFPAIRHADVIAQRALSKIKQQVFFTHNNVSLKKTEIIQDPSLWLVAKKM